MAKLKNPLLSLAAHNTLSKAITFVKRRGRNIAEKKPVITDAKSAAQLSWRHMYQKCAALWHALSAAEQADWNSLGGIRHMTGFAYWQSQCLKPNPGIYLPLQGGTMQGDIDMASFKLSNVPDPLAAQEPLTLAYYTANIAPYLYNEGCRVRHSVAQATLNITWTELAFNQERWDTDTMHDTVVNNHRITCKTAGKYIVIIRIRWEANNIGNRHLILYINNVTIVSALVASAVAGDFTDIGLSSIVSLGVGDYVNVIAKQNSGGNLNVLSSAQYSPEFMAQRIGS